MTAVLERSMTIAEPSRHRSPGPDFPTVAPPPRSRYRSGFWLAAAAFLEGKPAGLYTMKDVIGAL